MSAGSGAVRRPRVACRSSKQTLALIDRGGVTAAEIAGLARYTQTIVQTGFGLLLRPEPVLVGLTL